MQTPIANADVPPARLLTICLYIRPVPLVTKFLAAVASWLTAREHRLAGLLDRYPNSTGRSSPHEKELAKAMFVDLWSQE